VLRCERCGSSFSSMHAVGVENCPRCLLRDRTVAPLALKVFDLTDGGDAQARLIESRTEVPSAPDRIRTESQS
jgi:hypothetical protein